MSDVARRLVVSGRVQGVNYRAWLRERALAAGVYGYAANRADGGVEVWLEGPDDAVAVVEDAARQGPPWGEVDDVVAADVQPSGAHSFERR